MERQVEYICQMAPKGDAEPRWSNASSHTNKRVAKDHMEAMKESYSDLWKIRIIKRTTTEEVVE